MALTRNSRGGVFSILEPCREVAKIRPRSSSLSRGRKDCCFSILEPVERSQKSALDPRALSRGRKSLPSILPRSSRGLLCSDANSSPPQAGAADCRLATQAKNPNSNKILNFPQPRTALAPAPEVAKFMVLDPRALSRGRKDCWFSILEPCREVAKTVGSRSSSPVERSQRSALDPTPQLAGAAMRNANSSPPQTGAADCRLATQAESRKPKTPTPTKSAFRRPDSPFFAIRCRNRWLFPLLFVLLQKQSTLLLPCANSLSFRPTTK